MSRPKLTKKQLTLLKEVSDIRKKHKMDIYRCPKLVSMSSGYKKYYGYGSDSLYGDDGQITFTTNYNVSKIRFLPTKSKLVWNCIDCKRMFPTIWESHFNYICPCLILTHDHVVKTVNRALRTGETTKDIKNIPYKSY